MRVKTRLCFLLLCLSGLFALGQVYRFENYSTRDGLLSDDVYTMRQDHKGYLWLFTAYGAQKFDGSVFKPVLNNLPQAERFIYSSFEHSTGRMWVANSMARIYEVRNDSAFIVPGLDSITVLMQKTVAEISFLYADDSLNLYLFTKSNSYKLLKKKKGYRIIDLRQHYTSSTIACRVLKQEDVFIPTYVNREVAYFHQHDSALLEIRSVTGNSLYTIAAKANAIPAYFKKAGPNIYFILGNKILQLGADQKMRPLTFPTKVQQYAVDHRGHLWVGCLNNGLYELDLRNSIVGHYLENITVNHILIDSQQGLWASTSGEGLYHCANLGIRYYGENRPEIRQAAFIKQLGSKLAVANTKGDVFLMRDGEPSLLHQCHYRGTPYDIAEVSGIYFVAGLYHVECLGEDGTNLNRELKMNGFSTYGNKLCSLGPDTLVCLLRKGIAYYVKGQFKKLVSLDRKLFDCLWWNRHLFLCSEKGISLLQWDQESQPAFVKPASGLPIKGVASDSTGKLWFYTKGYGLFVLPPSGQLTRLTTAEGLPTDLINHIGFTDTSILLSTNRGLYLARYTETTSGLTWKCIYPEAINNAILHEGKIYLHTRNQLAVMDTDDKGLEPCYYLNLAGFSINSLPTDTVGLHSLAHDQNSLEFDFDLVAFTNVKPLLAYELQGPAAEKAISNVYNLRFGNLPPGHYTLTVTPQVKNGHLLQKDITFRIRPAFYQTWPFRLMTALVVLSLVTLSIWLIFRQRKKKEDLRTNAHRLVLEYKLIALKAQINPHFMSNCLASIQHLIITNKILDATHYISKFGMLVRQILNFSTRSLISIKEELEIAVLYLELEQMRFQQSFAFEVDLAPDVDPTTCLVPSLILNPILENAVWHGISSLPPGQQGRICLRIYREQGIIRMAVSDNGRGIVKKDPPAGSRRVSKGIGLIEQRLRNINFLYGTQSAGLSYHSHHESNGPSGTTAVITLPDHLEPMNHE